jgi:hypothetical protein
MTGDLEARFCPGICFPSINYCSSMYFEQRHKMTIHSIPSTRQVSTKKLHDALLTLNAMQCSRVTDAHFRTTSVF